MLVPSSSSFLHQSYEHDTVVAPCGFTDIAVATIHAGAAEDGNGSTSTQSKNKRWLVWVDKRRGLLGRTAVYCPCPVDPPAGRRPQSVIHADASADISSSRRKSLPIVLRPLGKLLGNERDHHDRHYGETAQAERRKSLPALVRSTTTSVSCTNTTATLAGVYAGEKCCRNNCSENGPTTTSRGPAECTDNGKAVERGNRGNGVGSCSDNGDDDDDDDDDNNDGQVHHPRGGGSMFIRGNESRTTSDTTRAQQQQAIEQDGRNDKANVPVVPSSSDSGAEAVEVLLRGLDRPTRIAVAGGMKIQGTSTSNGVFFIHSRTTRTTASLSANVASSSQKTHLVDLTKGRATTTTNSSHNRSGGKLSFFEWEVRKTTTLVEHLCDPVALCVQADLGVVFVLEAAWLGPSDNRCQQDRGSGRARQRYRVCYLEQSRVSSFLDESSRQKPTEFEEETTSTRENNGGCENDNQAFCRNLTSGQGQARRTSGRSERTDVSSEHESVTDWEVSSTSSTGGYHDDSNNNNNTFCRETSTAEINNSASSSPINVYHNSGQQLYRRERALDPTEAFVIPPSPPRPYDREEEEKDSEPPPLSEKPMDMCVLPDGTVVVAFCRLAPLHDGMAVAEAQGVVRAFPVAISPGHDPSSTASIATNTSVIDTAMNDDASSPVQASTTNSSKTPQRTKGALDSASPSRRRFRGRIPLTYHNPREDQWLIAEGLPVVTGIAASATGDAVYVSFCGSRRDGAVVAVGSLSTQRDGPPLRGASASTVSSLRSFATTRDREDVVSAGGVGGGSEVRAMTEMVNRRRCRASKEAVGSRDNDGVCGSGTKLVPIVSGFAAALTVDENNHLFYIAAENQGICRALWCRRAGASRRRVSSLRVNAPVLRITTDIHAAAAAATATASVAVFPNKTAESTAAICRSIGKPRKPKQDEGLSHKGKIRQAAAVAATARALSLSAALNEGDQVIPVGGGGRGRPPLFRTAVDDPTRAWEAAWELGGNNANELDVGVDEELVNIAVVARCRPLLAREIKRGVREAVFCKGDQVIVSGEELPIHRSRRFVFDRVFGPNTSQAWVYAETVAPIVLKMLDGYNCSVLAYGQTGSGKTFTMESGLNVSSSSPLDHAPPPRRTPGVADNPAGLASTLAPESTTDTFDNDTNACVEKLGVIPRAVHTIFREADASGSRRYWVYVSHMEIYNERLFDLLAPVDNNTNNNTASDASPSRSPINRSPRSPRTPSRLGGSSPRGSNRKSSPRPMSPCRDRRTSHRREYDTTAATSSSPRDNITAKGGDQASLPLSLSPTRRGMDKHHAQDGDRDRHSAADGTRSIANTPRSPLGTKKGMSRASADYGSGGGGGGSSSHRGASGGGVARTMGRGLTIEENPELGVMVKGLTQVEVRSPEEIFAIMARSKSNRRTAETMCNLESSRSHGVFCVRVISAEPTPWGGEVTRDGRLSLVDLSGSENIKRSGAVGARAKEAAAIGQSLLALGRVIKALVHRAPHVPYRESKLTRVLGDSLGGNAFTAIILNITPNHGMLDETLSTLAYAKEAQGVENTPKKHVNIEACKETDEADNTDDGYNTHGLGNKNAGKSTQGRMGPESVNTRRPSSAHVRPWEGKVPIHHPSRNYLLTMSPVSEPHSLSQSPLLSNVVQETDGAVSTTSRQHRHCRSSTVSTAATAAAARQRPATVGTARNASAAGAVSAANGQVINHGRGGGDFGGGGGGDTAGSSVGADAASVFSSQPRMNVEGSLGRLSLAGVDREFSSVSGCRRRLSSSASETAITLRAIAFDKTRNREGGLHGSRGGSRSTLPSKMKGGNCKGGGGGLSGGRSRSDELTAWKVFDSTAANWVHATVLYRVKKMAKKTTSSRGTNNNGRSAGVVMSQNDNGAEATIPTTTTAEGKRAKGTGGDGGSSPRHILRPAAVTALSEIFDRYDSDGRGYLVPDGVASLQEIWTCSYAQPPPPSLPCALRQNNLPSHIRTTADATKAQQRRGGATTICNLLFESGQESRRMLTLEAFLAFFEEAAARDAIFTKHLFVTCGYDSNLDLPSPSTAVAVDLQRNPPKRSAETTWDAAGRRGLLGSEQRVRQVGRRRHSTGDSDTSQERGNVRRNRREANRTGGSGDGASSSQRQTSRKEQAVMERLSLEKNASSAGDCYWRATSTGGIVDPADLWDRMEDRSDCGDRYVIGGGVLSRGGGAHFSPRPLASGGRAPAFVLSHDPTPSTTKTDVSSRPLGTEWPGDGGTLKQVEGGSTVGCGAPVIGHLEHGCEDINLGTRVATHSAIGHGNQHDTSSTFSQTRSAKEHGNNGQGRVEEKTEGGLPRKFSNNDSSKGGVIVGVNSDSVPARLANNGGAVVMGSPKSEGTGVRGKYERGDLVAGTTCEWCGCERGSATSVHTAAFCEEEGMPFKNQ